MNLNSDPLDCAHCGSHNAFVAPMKFNSTKRTVFSERRFGAVLLASVCLVWIAFISSSAQLKNQKRVTSVEMGQAAQGARVTIVSDSVLSDYEAFRRGDRFYVRIPLAEFAFSQPRFQGDGFEDVQVQKVGDSVVVSFKLQPGASARVDQRSNKLDVIFTAPNRIQRGTNASVASNRATSAGGNRRSVSQSNQDRQSDAAGPVPADFPKASRERFANGRRSEVDETQRQLPRNTRSEYNSARTSSSNATVVKPAPVNVASPAPVQTYSPPPSYTPATTSSPTSSTTYRPGSISANAPNLDQRSKVQQWVSANSNVFLFTVLVLAVLLLMIAATVYRRRASKPSATRANRPLAQPKYDTKVDFDELSSPRPPAVSADVSRFPETLPKSDRDLVSPKSAFAPAEVAASRASVVGKPSLSSVVVSDNESVSEEREVFEL